VRELLAAIQYAAREGDYAFTPHAFQRAEERDITPTEVEEALLAENAEIIENYPDDSRGPSCLILGWTYLRRPIHIQVCYPPLVEVITVYEPDKAKWRDFRIRS
jgi:hypothetical protein